MGVRGIGPTEWMTMQDWCDAMSQNLERFGSIGKLQSDMWREWALQLLNLPQLAGSIVPNPYDFEDWREWARRFDQNLAGVP